MIFIYFLAGIVSLIAWLLLSTIVVRLDTDIPHLILEWRTVAGIRATWEEDTIAVEIKTGLFRRKWLPLRTQRSKPRKTTKRSTHGKPPDAARIIRTLKGCRLDYFDLALDSGNPLINAWLYPLNFVSLPTGRTIRINFENYNHLRLQISAKPWRLLAAWIK
jgi:hypothetical protein